MADCTYRGHRCLVLAPGLLLRLEGEGAPCIEVAAPNGAGPLSLPLTAEHSAYLQGRLATAGEYDDAGMDPKKVKDLWERQLSRADRAESIPRSDAGASQLAAQLSEAIVRAGEPGLATGRIRAASEASIVDIMAAGRVAPYVAVAALISAYFLQGSGGDQHPPPAKDDRKSAGQELRDLLADLRRRQTEERATEKARPSP